MRAQRTRLVPEEVVAAGEEAPSRLRVLELVEHGPGSENVTAEQNTGDEGSEHQRADRQRRRKRCVERGPEPHLPGSQR